MVAVNQEPAVSKFRPVIWTMAKVAILREVVPVHGVGRAAVLLGVTEPTVRKKMAQLGDIGIGGQRVQKLADHSHRLRLLWAKDVPRHLIGKDLGVSLKTLYGWVRKLELPARPHLRSSFDRPLFPDQQEAAVTALGKPIVTKNCFYAPTCKETIRTVRGGPRMCAACLIRVTGY